MSPRRLAGLVALLTVAGCGGAHHAERYPQGLTDSQVEPGYLVVDFDDGISQQEVDTLEKGWGLDLHFNSVEGEADGVTIGRFAGDLATLLARIRRSPEVEAAEPLYRYHALFTPNDPDFKYQWHMKTVHAPEAWDYSRGKGVTVAVIDTGIAYADYQNKFKAVEDLEGASLAPGWDFVHDRKEALDDNGHGTHVAGTIAQVTDNGVGVTGLAPEATLMPLKVLSAQGAGNSADIADAIRWAADHGANVINMSLGGGAYSVVMASAVKYAENKGVVIVAAAGNNGTGHVSYPAAYKGVIAVSATRFDDQLAPYSSWGKQISIAAPGGDKSVDQNHDGKVDGILQNTIVQGDPTRQQYALFQGTSMASPHVAGAAALVMATGVTDPAAVKEALFSTARKVHGRTGWDEKYGFGVLDAGAAVKDAKEETGLWRLVAAFLVAGLLFLKGRKGPGGALASTVLRPSFAVALLLTSAGLFFLPALIPWFPGMRAASTPLMDWGLLAFGAGGHANPLGWSAILPFALALFLFQVKALRPALAGIAAGAAAFLLQSLLAGDADVVLIPGRFLDGVWLLVNAAAALLLAWTLTRREPAAAPVASKESP